MEQRNNYNQLIKFSEAPPSSSNNALIIRSESAPSSSSNNNGSQFSEAPSNSSSSNNNTLTIHSESAPSSSSSNNNALIIHDETETETETNVEEYLNSFPPGFRFCPKDEELIEEYLKKKVHNEPLPPNRICEVNIYSKPPDELVAAFKPTNGEDEGKVWYFFTPRHKKYPNGKRPKRSASDKGYWKPTGTDKDIRNDAGQIIGKKKTLDYLEGSHRDKVTKTIWKMHEYKLNDEDNPSRTIARDKNDMTLDDCVLCRLYTKKGKDKDDKSKDQEATDDQMDVEHQPSVILSQNHQQPSSMSISQNQEASSSLAFRQNQQASLMALISRNQQALSSKALISQNQQASSSMAFPQNQQASSSMAFPQNQQLSSMALISQNQQASSILALPRNQEASSMAWNWNHNGFEQNQSAQAGLQYTFHQPSTSHGLLLGEGSTNEFEQNQVAQTAFQQKGYYHQPNSDQGISQLRDLSPNLPYFDNNGLPVHQSGDHTEGELDYSIYDGLEDLELRPKGI